MYIKRCTGVIIVQKYENVPEWVKWVHHSEGKTHCPVCLRLDGCYFTKLKHPPHPHHPYCHCTLEDVSHTEVMAKLLVHSDYSKFDPYLFDPNNFYKHGKNRAFESWGYTVEDARWLQAEMERQAKEKYLREEYNLGKLDKNGQRISIRIEIPRKNQEGTVSYISGWMVYPNGEIKLATPYGGK